jgi:hypothetical protein
MRVSIEIEDVPTGAVRVLGPGAAASQPAVSQPAVSQPVARGYDGGPGVSAALPAVSPAATPVPVTAGALDGGAAPDLAGPAGQAGPAVQPPVQIEVPAMPGGAYQPG